MDKNLKKLSRIELLELMVSLSEDYEALADENERLKKMVSAQRLPRSTRVGSIAEAALAANGYFESAQRSADEYLREIKHLRDELQRRVDAHGSARGSARVSSASQADLARAQDEARRIVAQANSQAEAIVSAARARADEAIANANRQAHAILSQARSQIPVQDRGAQAMPASNASAIPNVHAGMGAMSGSPSFAALNLTSRQQPDPSPLDYRLASAARDAGPQTVGESADPTPRHGRHSRTTERKSS